MEDGAEVGSAGCTGLAPAGAHRAGRRWAQDMISFGAFHFLLFFHAQHQLSIKSDRTQKTKQEGQPKPPWGGRCKGPAVPDADFKRTVINALKEIKDRIKCIGKNPETIQKKGNSKTRNHNKPN